MFNLWLFFKRGLLTTLSYRTALILSILSGFISILQFTLMGNFLSEGNSFPAIQQYGGNLLAYLIVGTAFTSFLTVSLNSFQTTIRNEQQMGTLEHLLMTDISLEKIILYSSAWNFIWTIINVGVLLSIVVFFFNVPMNVNLMSALIILFLTLTALLGLGLMSAGIIMVTKQGDPITWIFSILTGILSGVLFPVERLPKIFQILAYLLPTTHSLHGLRLAFLKNMPPTEMLNVIFSLVIFTLILVPSGFLVFRFGCKYARHQGSLAHY